MILYGRIKDNATTSPFGTMRVNGDGSIGRGHLLRGWEAGIHIADMIDRPSRILARHLIEADHDMDLNDETFLRVQSLSTGASIPTVEDRRWLQRLHVHLHRDLAPR